MTRRRDWLCNGERERWSNEIIDRRNHALAWMVFATIPGAMVAGAAMALVWFSSMATVIVAMAALAFFFPILGFAVRNAVGDAASFLSLRRRGHSEISSHILETFGGSVWLLGRKGLYFTCKPTPWKDEQRKVECASHTRLWAASGSPTSMRRLSWS